MPSPDFCSLAQMPCPDLFEALARVARWIRVTPADKKPPIGMPVRVVWHERGKSDPKRAVWTGEYWATVQRRGHYECSPDWWLYEPPLPEPPTSR